MRMLRTLWATGATVLTIAAAAHAAPMPDAAGAARCETLLNGYVIPGDSLFFTLVGPDGWTLVSERIGVFVPTGGGVRRCRPAKHRTRAARSGSSRVR